MEGKKQIYYAQSKKNGMVFYSNINPRIGAEAYIDDCGAIRTRIIYTIVNEYLSLLEIEKNQKNDKWKVITFDIFLIILSLLTKNFLVVFAAIYFSLTVSVKIFEFGKSSYKMKSKNEKGRTIAKFHAAEHMVINAYEKFQRIPTFDEVKKSSRFSKVCGSNKMICEIILYSLISLMDAIIGISNNYVLICIFFIAIILVVIGGPKGWLKFMQVFITTPPTDIEIKLAIEGVRAFDELEKRQKENGRTSFEEIEYPSELEEIMKSKRIIDSN